MKRFRAADAPITLLTCPIINSSIVRWSDVSEWEELEDALARYISILTLASKETTHSSDRPRYNLHLAQAAKMFPVIRSKNDLAVLKDLVEQERHNYGWGYLSDGCGERAEAAFTEFVQSVERFSAAG